MLLRRHNLNLLPILRELLRTQSVSRAAESIGLGQSSVSAALANLREIFHDDLLVQVGRKMELTNRARQLWPQVERAYAETEALLQPQIFDPLTLKRVFVIATSDYVTALLAPALTQIVATAAPQVELHFSDLTGDIAGNVAKGDVDVAIVPRHAVGGWTEIVEVMPIWHDATVVIASRKLRAFEGPMTREVFENAQHAIFQLAPRSEITFPTQMLRAKHLSLRNAVHVQQFLALAPVVASSGCIALIQGRLARHFAPIYDLEIFEVPFDTVPLEVNAYWSRTSARDHAAAWLRDSIAEAAARVVAAQNG